MANRNAGNIISNSSIIVCYFNHKTFFPVYFLCIWKDLYEKLQAQTYKDFPKPCAGSGGSCVLNRCEHLGLSLAKPNLNKETQNLFPHQHITEVLSSLRTRHSVDPL